MHSGLSSTFDPSTRVQDDLFGFVNNDWIRRTEIPSDRARYGSFDQLRESAEAQVRALVERAVESGGPAGSAERKVGDLYASFMDADAIERAGVEPLREPLAAVAGVTSISELCGLMGELSRGGSWGCVALYVSADAKDPDRYIAYLSQSGLSLPDESYYRQDAYADVRAKFVAHVTRMAELAVLPDPAGFAERVMAVETRIASHHWDVVATRDALKTYNKRSCDELKELAPTFDWDAWTAGLGASVAVLDPVVVGEPSFLEGLSAALGEVALESWKAWLGWRVVSDLAPYLSEALVEESFAFNGRVLSGTPQLRERWKRGVSVVESALGEAVGELYVAEHFPPHAKERMQQLVGNIIEAYRRDFESLEWMSPATRERALAKLSRFRSKIGYPERWRDYSSLAIAPGDLLGNVRRSAEFELKRHLDRVGQEVDRSEWLMTPQTVNAYYHPVMNEIVFPAAILQPPFFDADADDAVNYGGIGGVIGHEIGHGFDDQGSRYDGDGSLTDWWTPEDRSRFDALAQRLIGQFDRQSPADAPDVTVNGGLTVGENIGDLGGLTIGYKAYAIAQETQPAPVLDGFDGDQRFFLGWSQVWCGKARPDEARRLVAIDPHAPMNCRANVARNLREFHEAFGVQPGDGMYLPPGEQVRIF